MLISVTKVLHKRAAKKAVTKLLQGRLLKKEAVTKLLQGKKRRVQVYFSADNKKMENKK